MVKQRCMGAQTTYVSCSLFCRRCSLRFVLPALQDGISFHATRDRLLPRPWVVDCFDALLDRLSGGPAYRKAVLFVDNSGADLVLGG